MKSHQPHFCFVQRPNAEANGKFSFVIMDMAWHGINLDRLQTGSFLLFVFFSEICLRQVVDNPGPKGITQNVHRGAESVPVYKLM